MQDGALALPPALHTEVALLVAEAYQKYLTDKPYAGLISEGIKQVRSPSAPWGRLSTGVKAAVAPSLPPSLLPPSLLPPSLSAPSLPPSLLPHLCSFPPYVPPPMRSARTCDGQTRWIL